MNRTDAGRNKKEGRVGDASQKGGHLLREGQKGTKTQVKQAVIQELGRELALRSERMRLLSRVELTDDGLDEDSLTDRRAAEVNGRPRGKENAVVIPQPSPARQRHRQRGLARDGGRRPRVDIQNYRPDYTWNRGGRVKELRIRYQARKYFHLWVRNTFGRVRLSKARELFRRKLLRKVFTAWRDEWWEVRQEWRLSVRAQCHHRYKVWSQVFQAWKDFIIRCRIKNAKVDCAYQLANKMTMKRALAAWRVYHDSRQRRKKEKEKADKFHHDFLERWAWSQWEQRLTLQQHRQEMASVALQFWAFRVQAQHWLMWVERLKARRIEQHRLALAARHHNQGLLQRCLQAWVACHRHRQARKVDRDYGDKVYQASLRLRCFQHWASRWSTRCAMARHQEEIAASARRSRLHRVFLHWRHYIVLIKDERKKERMADLHYLHHLLRLGLSAFRLHVVQKRIKWMRERMANHFHHLQVQRLAWRRWLEAVEEREEARLLPLTHTARSHYRKHLLTKCFQGFQVYVVMRRHKQVRYAKAGAHYYLRIMPQCLYAWQAFVQLMKTKRENAQTAIEFREERGLARYFSLWQTEFQRSRERRLMERMAILHYEGKLAVRYLAVWRCRTALALEEAEKCDMADRHYAVEFCRRHIRAWHNYVRSLRTLESMEVAAAKHRYLAVLHRGMVQWRQQYEKRKALKKKEERADQHHHQRLCRLTFAAWKKYTARMRQINSRAEIKFRRKCLEKKRWVLSVWRNNVQQEVQDRLHMQAAVVFYNRMLLCKVVDAWHQHAILRAYRKTEERRAIEAAQDQLNRGRLRHCLRVWRVARDEAITLHLKWEQASLWHRRRTLVRVLAAWQEFSHTSIREHLLARQSHWFLAVRLQSRCFTLWRRRHQEAQEEARKTGLALWQWSLVLQRKVLYGWMAYVGERRRKKMRDAEAMERRRVRLLKEGLAQWLTVAQDFAAMRLNFAAQHQAQCVHQGIQLVQRCGWHWRRWAARRRLARQAAAEGGQGLSKTAAAASSHLTAPLPQSRLPTAAALTSFLPSLLPRESQSAAPPFQLAPPAPPAPPLLAGKESFSAAAVPPSLKTVPPLLPSGPPAPPAPSAAPPAPTQATSPTRPAKAGEDLMSVLGMPRRARTEPRRPPFLIDSLKRAGLFSPADEGPPEPASHPFGGGTAEAHVTSDSTSTDLAPKDSSTSMPPPNNTMDSSEDASKCEGATGDASGAGGVFSLSGDAHTGSTSAAHADVDAPVRALHFSGTSDSEAGPPAPRGHAERSPSTQRSQPSGHPLLFSSPISRDGGQMAVAGMRGLADHGILNGNLLGEGGAGRRRLQQQQAGALDSGILLTPEDFVANSDRLQRTFHPLPSPSPHDSPGRVEGNQGGGGGFVTPRNSGRKNLGVMWSPPLAEEAGGGGGRRRDAGADAAAELVSIRNRLKAFKEEKKRLKTLEKQHLQVQSWLQSQESRLQRGQGSRPDVDLHDVEELRREAAEMLEELEQLRPLVAEQQRECPRLVDRARQLAAELGAAL